MGNNSTKKYEFPYRGLFGWRELLAVFQVFRLSWKRKKDFGFQEDFEEKLTNTFGSLHGENLYVDGVSSGTAAVYIALKAYDIKEGDDVIVSPITNPGSIMPVLMTGCKIVVPDAADNSLNMAAEQIEGCITKDTKAVVLTHLGGMAAEVENIMKVCKKHGIKLIEDCSQSYLAKTIQGNTVGTIGDISVFSSMYSKTFSTGGTGGMTMTKSVSVYNKMRSIADRGKQFERPDFNVRQTDLYLFPSFNFNLDEISAAIGASIARRLPAIVQARRDLAVYFCKRLANECTIFKSLYSPEQLKRSSPFFISIMIDIDSKTPHYQEVLRLAKNECINECLPVNADYRDYVHLWNWIDDEKLKMSIQANSKKYRDIIINILFNERFNLKDIDKIVMTFADIEKKLITEFDLAV